MTTQDEPKELWISWKPFTKEPLGRCTNVLKLVTDYAQSAHESLHVINYSEYKKLKEANIKMIAALEEISSNKYMCIYGTPLLPDDPKEAFQLGSNKAYCESAHISDKALEQHKKDTL